MSVVRAWISFVRASDSNPEPWDGILLTSRGQQIEAMYVVCENKKLAQLTPDGMLRIAGSKGPLKPSADMAALGRAVYRAMTGQEPPS